jgi:ribosomal protein S21
MPDSNIANNGGPGAVNSKKFKKAVQRWGSLPEKERRSLIQELTKGMSDKHAQAIQEYFKRLSENQRVKK